MEGLVIIGVIFNIIIDSAAFIADDTNEVCKKYKDGDTQFYFPGDGDGKVHLVDVNQKDNESSLTFRLGEKEKYVYHLYTRKNPKVEQILIFDNANSVKTSNYDAKKITVFLVHGWKGHGKNTMNLKLREAFLYNDDVNIIVLDWSVTANYFYITAKDKVPKVGRELGKFVMWLTTLGASYEKIHLVGFSLGAHVVGNAGRATGAKVKRITALDPAGPMWHGNANRILKTDAKYVEVIHTNTNLYGYTELCGHADFFPNGGGFMPGCLLNVCSHSRAYEYMSYSVQFDNMFSKECNSLDDACKDRCGGTLYPMGNSDLSKSRSGIFRVNTDAHLPDTISKLVASVMPGKTKCL